MRYNELKKLFFVVSYLCFYSLVQSQEYYSSPSYGGQGGIPFDDLAFAKTQGVDLNQINLRSGVYIDGIQVVYQRPGDWHGGQGGVPDVMGLDFDEQIIQVDIRHGAFIDGLTFYTNKGVVKQFGGTGGSLTSVSPGNGFYLFSIRGRSGKYLDNIGLIWKR